MQLLSKVKSLFAKHDKRQEKELQEDFLKAIYEQGGSISTDEAKRSAKTLHTNNEGISAIVGALALQGEITIGEQLKLTEKGRTHALKLIRAHRIYEQYLAEHSGYAPPEWHERHIAWSIALATPSKNALHRCWVTRFSTLMATPFRHIHWK